MARKSSKTAHVMNLLAGNDKKADEQSEENESVGSPSGQPDVSSTTTVKEMNVVAQQASINTSSEPAASISVIDVSNSEHDPVAEMIKNTLEQENTEILESLTSSASPSETGVNSIVGSETGEEPSHESPYADEESNSFSIPEEDAVELSKELEESVKEDLKPISEPENLPDQESASPEESELSAPDQPEVSPQPSDSSDNSPSSSSDEPQSDTPSPVSSEKEPEQPEDDFLYINVIEHVVNEMLEDYMERFSVCTCSRCIADIKALTLTNLPPKYIVANHYAVSPLLNFYTSRYTPQVVVELTKACSTVKENPHH